MHAAPAGEVGAAGPAVALRGGVAAPPEGRPAAGAVDEVTARVAVVPGRLEARDGRVVERGEVGRARRRGDRRRGPVAHGDGAVAAVVVALVQAPAPAAHRVGEPGPADRRLARPAVARDVAGAEADAVQVEVLEGARLDLPAAAAAVVAVPDHHGRHDQGAQPAARQSAAAVATLTSASYRDAPGQKRRSARACQKRGWSWNRPRSPARPVANGSNRDSQPITASAIATWSAGKCAATIVSTAGRSPRAAGL